MSAVTAAILVSTACGLLIGTIVLVLVSDRRGPARRVGAYINPVVTLQDPKLSLIERALGDPQAQKTARSPLETRIRTELEIAELSVTPRQLVAATVVVTLLVGWLLYTAVNTPVAAFLALLVPVSVKLAVDTKADKQRRAFMEQLPDNLQALSAAMRAGQNFVGGLRSVAEDAPEPSKRELRRAVLDEAIGVPLDAALGAVTDRMRSDDFQHVAVVAALQRETGGSSADVLDLLADTVRERIEIRRLVRGLTAQGRLSGYVLSLMPVAILILISIINPTYVHPLFHTTVGLVGLGIGFVLIVGGALTIRRIVDIKV
ncbi:MAG: type II secretion system F family protein [Solirubrobacteraceae bacterium]